MPVQHNDWSGDICFFIKADMKTKFGKHMKHQRLGDAIFTFFMRSRKRIDFILISTNNG